MGLATGSIQEYRGSEGMRDGRSGLYQGSGMQDPAVGMRPRSHPAFSVQRSASSAQCCERSEMEREAPSPPARTTGKRCVDGRSEDQPGPSVICESAFQSQLENKSQSESCVFRVSVSVSVSVFEGHGSDTLGSYPCRTFHSPCRDVGITHPGGQRRPNSGPPPVWPNRSTPQWTTP